MNTRFVRILFLLLVCASKTTGAFVVENGSYRIRTDRRACVEEGGFFWDFRGHSCYAERLPASQPTTQKPAILLIHGFACSTVYWRATKSYLTKEGYEVHSLDLLGQGKSSKPDQVVYSIDLWAQMVDEYANRYLSSDVVLVGNSLGSLVALSAATGDSLAENAFLPSNTKGLCFFNCGVGMNTKNMIRTASSPWTRAFLKALFGVLDKLVFGNKALLTYLMDRQVSKELLSNALKALYAEETRVDDELVDSFLDPVKRDDTQAVVNVLSQIYTNDPGRTPMELHEMYWSSPPPMHLLWGDKDTVTPIEGDVGQFYTQLAATSENVTMEIVPNAGHVLFDEKPECNAGLIKWLEATFG